MSILIPDMEMPSNCAECRFNMDSWCYAYPQQKTYEPTHEVDRTCWCPLVEVKTPRSPMSDKDLEACNFEL